MQAEIWHKPILQFYRRIQFALMHANVPKIRTKLYDYYLGKSLLSTRYLCFSDVSSSNLTQQFRILRIACLWTEPRMDVTTRRVKQSVSADTRDGACSTEFWPHSAVPNSGKGDWAILLADFLFQVPRGRSSTKHCLSPSVAVSETGWRPWHRNRSSSLLPRRHAD